MEPNNVETIATIDGIIYEKRVSPTGDVSIIAKPSPYYTTETATDWRNYDMTSRTMDTGLSIYDWQEIRNSLKREIEESESVNVEKKKSYNSGEHIIACSNADDLSTDRILKTLSAVKGRLMLDVAPVHIHTIECIMTPAVRKNIVTASKRLKMFGKKRPIIARFDEYGNRLPDEIEIGDTNGITLKIVDPSDYGEYYFELKGTEFPQTEYKIRMDSDYVEDEFDDLPF